MRDSESQRDEDFSREISAELGFRFEIGHWNHTDSETKISENSARDARYAFLEKMYQKYSAKYILTAHHKDDQAETVFLQFLRGGGVNALTGMKKIQKFSGTKNKDYVLYRALLGVSKSEILQYLAEKNINFSEDSTNAESIFTRNFLRNEVFPLLETKFSGFSNRIAEKSEYFQILQNEFEISRDNFLENRDLKKGILKNEFEELSSPVQFEVIKTIIAPKYCDQKLFTEILEFIKNGKSGKKFILKNCIFEVFGEKVFVL